MASEKLFENKVKKWLHTQGIYSAGHPIQSMTVKQKGWYFKVFGGGFQKSGIPDVIACINGVFFSIELKASVGTPSELQKLNTKRINKSNGIGLILYPEGFEEFKQIVEGVLQCNYHIPELNSLKEIHSNTNCDILTD
ncbi:VRR-NUC domain-containing protein [Mycobacteroides abscessus]|uniref:VRR-NUC domain-containing protein n=1 Tax=unclassified Desemzia TaxID=2685243 RepID=UPI0009A8EEB5